MIQKIIMNILLLASLFQLFIGCKEKGTEPPPTKPFKNPREMTWTADTLQTPEGAIQLLPQNLLVFSPTDAWLVCWSDVLNGLVWAHDGKKWTESNSIEELGGFRVKDIAGKSSMDLWTAGYSGENVFMAHYNGTIWERFYPNIKGDILDMSTEPNGNIWACGRNGLVIKYENNKWIADTITVGYHERYPDAQYLLNSVQYYKDSIYILGSIFDYNRRRDIYYFFSGDIHNWQLKDSMVIDSPSSIIRWGYYGLHLGSNSELYSFGLRGIWKYSNNQWKSIFELDYQIYGIYAVDNNYMFAMGPFNHAYFYDGTNWENINEKLGVSDPQFVFANVWTNGYETFITGYGTIDGTQKTIIWHGK